LRFLLSAVGGPKQILRTGDNFKSRDASASKNGVFNDVDAKV